MSSESIFTRELLDRALLSSGLHISGSLSVLEKGRDKLSYLRKCDRPKYDHLLFRFDRAGTFLKIINTEKTMNELEEIFS